MQWIDTHVLGSIGIGFVDLGDGIVVGAQCAARDVVIVVEDVATCVIMGGGYVGSVLEYGVYLCLALFAGEAGVGGADEVRVVAGGG